MALIKTLTKQDFTDNVTNNTKLVLVDFWAEWCPPCRAMAPILEKVAKKLDERVDIVKLNIEESADNNQLAAENGVMSIPNMVVYKDGKEVDRIIGLTPEEAMVTRLSKLAA